MVVNLEHPHLILASASPRRKELLEQVWIAADIMPADIDETAFPNEEPLAHVARLAKEKGNTIAEKYPASYVLSADTVVISPCGQILGKPKDDADAARMLGLLQSSTHTVATGFAITCKEKDLRRVEVVETKVEMVSLSTDEIESYVSTEEPKGKAGAYAIQGAATGFIKSIDGSYSNVVGLPLVEVSSVLIELGAISSRI